MLYGLLIKFEVKMLDIGQVTAILTKQAWSRKDLLNGFQGHFSCGTQQVVLSGQDSFILPAQAANHSARFGSSCIPQINKLLVN